MKLLILLLLFIAPRSFLSQEYKSSVTAHPKIQYELEYIDRNIEFKPDKIIITSKGKEVKDIQELNIQSQEEKVFGEIGLCTWYYCNSREITGTEKLVIVPIKNETEQIIIFEPILNGATSREFRIILD